MRLLAVGELHRAEGHGRIRERHRERHPPTHHSAAEARGVQHAEVHGMRGDVLLAGDVKSPLGVGNDLFGDVAVGTANVHVGAGVVRDQPGVLATPGARDTALGRPDARRVTRAEDRGCRHERDCCLGEHTV